MKEILWQMRTEFLSSNIQLPPYPLWGHRPYGTLSHLTWQKALGTRGQGISSTKANPKRQKENSLLLHSRLKFKPNSLHQKVPVPSVTANNNRLQHVILLFSLGEVRGGEGSCAAHLWLSCSVLLFMWVKPQGGMSLPHPRPPLPPSTLIFLSS